MFEKEFGNFTSAWSPAQNVTHQNFRAKNDLLFLIAHSERNKHKNPMNLKISERKKEAKKKIRKSTQSPKKETKNQILKHSHGGDVFTGAGCADPGAGGR